MFGIIYKNLIESRRAILLTLLGVVFVMFVFTFMVIITYGNKENLILSFMLILGMLCSYTMIGNIQGTIISCDQNSRFYSFVFSAPNGRLKFIAAKYLAMLLISAVTTGAFMLLAYLLDCDILPIIAAFTLVQLLMCAIETPFMIALGAKTGAGVKGCIFGGAAMAFIIYELYGEYSLFTKEFDITPIIAFFTENFGSDTSRLMWITIAAAAVLVLYAASMLLSFLLSKKGATRFAATETE